MTLDKIFICNKFFLAIVALLVAGRLMYVSYFFLDTAGKEQEWGEGVVESTGVDVSGLRAAAFVQIRINGVVTQVNLPEEKAWMMTWGPGSIIYCFYQVGRFSGKVKVSRMTHSRSMG